MAFALGHLGHTLVLLADNSSIPKELFLGHRYTKAEVEESFPHNLNIELASNDSLLSDPPDVVFGWARSARSVLFHLFPILKKSNPSIKLAFFTGNDSDKYPWAHVKNILLTDGAVIKHVSAINVPNWMLWTPWIDFENELAFKNTSTNPSVGSYIGRYTSRFPNSYNLLVTLREQYRKLSLALCDFYIYENSSRKQTLINMRAHAATMHVKEAEGFGYSIIESLAIGRPVFLYRPFSKNKRYRRWCIEGKTAFYFSSPEEFNEKLHRYMNDPEWQIKVQKECAQTIRKIINNHNEAQRLQYFLDNLVPQG